MICCKGGAALKSELRLAEDIAAEEISQDLNEVPVCEMRRRINSESRVYE